MSSDPQHCVTVRPGAAVRVRGLCARVMVEGDGGTNKWRLGAR